MRQKNTFSEKKHARDSQDLYSTWLQSGVKEVWIVLCWCLCKPGNQGIIICTLWQHADWQCGLSCHCYTGSVNRCYRTDPATMYNRFVFAKICSRLQTAVLRVFHPAHGTKGYQGSCNFDFPTCHNVLYSVFKKYILLRISQQASAITSNNTAMKRRSMEARLRLKSGSLHNCQLCISVVDVVWKKLFLYK